jgi:DNA adenine methylase
MAYPGGKSGAGVYQTIINLMPPHTVYIEPFLGGGAVMRLKRPALLNIGVDLVASSDLPVSAAIAFSDGGGSARAGTDDISLSPGPLVVSGGECRRGSSFLTVGSGSVGTGDSGSSSGPLVVSGGNRSIFRFFQRDGIEFLCSYPFTGSELVYCDPPYLASTRSGGRLYLHEMTDTQHSALLAVLCSLPCMVMLSGYWSALYARALRRWNRVSFQAMTRGGVATEWLWFNFPRPVALHDYRYLGENFRERERIKRKKARWTARLGRMPALERQALLGAISEAWGSA